MSCWINGFDHEISEYRSVVSIGYNRLSAEWHRHKEKAEDKTQPLEVRQQALRFLNMSAKNLRLLQEGGPYMLKDQRENVAGKAD